MSARGMAAQVSVVIPVLDDAVALESLLAALGEHAGTRLEVVVADGGSRDDPRSTTARHGARLVMSCPGRGRQLAAGIEAARGRWLWLLHADSNGIDAAARYLLSLDDDPAWGRFDIRFLPGSAGMSLVGAMMNLRSRVSGICTGDQGMFVHRALLAAAGGMPAQPLMEDIELSRRLKRLARPRCRRETVTTSSRRWRQRGLARTVAAMWWCRFRYWRGADPADLARDYYR